MHSDKLSLSLYKDEAADAGGWKRGHSRRVEIDAPVCHPNTLAVVVNPSRVVENERAMGEPRKKAAAPVEGTEQDQLHHVLRDPTAGLQ